MTAPADEFAPPEFDLVDLDVEVPTARDRIEATVEGLVASETDAGVKYRTVDGTLVATVAPGSDHDGATLAYRTAPAVVPATRTARRLVKALEDDVAE